MLFCNIVDLSILRVLPGNMVPSSLMRTLNWSLRFFSDLLRDTLWMKTRQFSYQRGGTKEPWSEILSQLLFSPKGLQKFICNIAEALKMWGFTVWPCPSHLLPLTHQWCCRHPCREKTKSKEEPKTFIRTQILIDTPVGVYYCLTTLIIHLTSGK